MNPNVIPNLAAALISQVRGELDENISNYQTALLALYDAIDAKELPGLWRAVNEACDAEYALGGGVGACPVAQYHDTLSIPDCYEPGENGKPCKAYDASEHYCRRECPLRGWTTKKR